MNKMAKKEEIVTKNLTAEPAVEAATYTIDELARAANHGKFPYTGALVAAALQETGRKRFTLAEAQEIATAFAKRPVTR